MALAIVAHQREPTNALLAARLGACLLSPRTALATMRRGDLALVRLDVRGTLDGVEPGLDLLEPLERRGVQVMNHGPALLAVHDKLRTAELLHAAGLQHPHTACVRTVDELLELKPPFVLKPRFGSWGRDVVRCLERGALEARAAWVQRRPWFRRTGAIVQELLPARGYDLRVVVGRGRVLGAVERHARPGEWRTNVSLGAVRTPVVPPSEACELALAAASAVEIDVAGVDLFPVGGSFVPLELNGAADFDESYSLPGGRSVFDELLAVLSAELLPA